MSIVYLTLGCWALLEMGLRVRDHAHHSGTRDWDRATRVLIGVALAATFVLATDAPSLRIPGPIGQSA